MNNKCFNGCDQGFVPVNTNWDFNMEREDCAPRRRRTDNACAREQDDCQPCARTVNYNREREECEGQNRGRNTNCGCEEQRFCEGQNRTRNTNCNCEEKNPCESQNHSRNISCVREAKSCTSQRRWQSAMVKIDDQELGEMYQAEAALKAGTLFPELHKPMRGYCPEGGLCHDDCQAEAFTLWELRLYLNTHPDDKEAMALFRHLCKDACNPNYATSFLTDENCAGWSWGKNPWPWEIEFNGCNCKKEGHGHVCV